MNETHTLAKRLCVTQHLVCQDVIPRPNIQEKKFARKPWPEARRKHCGINGAMKKMRNGINTSSRWAEKMAGGARDGIHLSGLSAVCERYLMKSPGMARPSIAPTCGPMEETPVIKSEATAEPHTLTHHHPSAAGSQRHGQGEIHRHNWTFLMCARGVKQRAVSLLHSTVTGSQPSRTSFIPAHKLESTHIPIDALLHMSRLLCGWTYKPDHP